MYCLVLVLLLLSVKPYDWCKEARSAFQTHMLFNTKLAIHLYFSALGSGWFVV